MYSGSASWAVLLVGLFYTASSSFGFQPIVKPDPKESDGDISGFHLDPQIAVLCEPLSQYQYQCQYEFMSENGKWNNNHTRRIYTRNNGADDKSEYKVSENQYYVHDNEKLKDILQYCVQAYPDREITNIVEASHFIEIGNWCNIGQLTKCKRKEWVKPHRCLEGPFQSDALLVPENCVFDHIHNQSQCWPFEHWNRTASNACQERYMVLHSFAMLLPCGLSLFSGVEFVCCPYKGELVTEYKSARKPYIQVPGTNGLYSSVDISASPKEPVNAKTSSTGVNVPAPKDDNDEDDYGYVGSDDEAEDYEDNPVPHSVTPASHTSTISSSTLLSSLLTTEPSVETSSANDYFTHFNPHEEHKAYKKARKQLEETHRDKVTKVMKDWADLEERYQEMKSKDLHAAEEFKKRMTVKFQQTVQSLEEEEKAETQQLIAMHQQRINAYIHQQKKEAMNCFTRSFNENQPPIARKVQKCLQKLLKSLYKDRHHTISHYRHLLLTNPSQADRERPVILEHLADINNMMNQSITMLDRYPTVFADVRRLMSEYAQALKKKDDFVVPVKSVQDNEFKIQPDKMEELHEYVSDEGKKMENWEHEKNNNLLKTKSPTKYAPTENDHTLTSTTTTIAVPTTSANTPMVTPIVFYKSAIPIVAAAEMEHKEVQPHFAHSLTNDLMHNEPIYTFKKEPFANPYSLHYTLLFAVMSLMSVVIVGVILIRQRNSRSPQNQGFIEVNQAVGPEERHVANMQINGYENPTYKYFDIKP